MLHGDGEIYLIYFQNQSERFCYSVMQSDISKDIRFSKLLPENTYYDWETPYGYGGPLCDGIISDQSAQLFRDEITKYCIENGIVSQFVRFHPLLRNYEVIPSVIESRYLKDSIYIDTSDRELIIKNMDTKNRNMVRKAVKNGVTIEKRDISDYSDFLDMYNETMKNNGATDYYSFSQDYFESLKDMCDNAFIVYAMYEGMAISASIMFFNDRFMHYHLSGSRVDYRQYSPSNLLLFETANMACDMGITQFHLGGGIDSEDSLFGFKKQFNKNGRARFVVGRTIFDRDLYELLLQKRKENDSDFDINNSRMIQYRR